METFTHPGKLPRPQDSAKPLMMIESVSAPGWKHAELQTLECAARLVLGLEGGRRVRFFFFFLFFWRWGLGWGSLHWWLRCVCLCLSKMRKHSEPVTACAFTTLNLRPYSLKGAGQAPANSAQKQKAVCQEHHLLRDIVILMGARRRCFFFYYYLWLLYKEDTYFVLLLLSFAHFHIQNLVSLAALEVKVKVLACWRYLIVISTWLHLITFNSHWLIKLWLTTLFEIGKL